MDHFQQLIINLADPHARVLGVLTIRAKIGTGSESYFDKSGIQCWGIREVAKPGVSDPLELCVINPIENIYQVMLIEETDYYVRFVAVNDAPIESFLPGLERQLQKNLFNEQKNVWEGILNFGAYVGRTAFRVIVNGCESALFPIEVRSKKLNYDDEYMQMLHDLSRDCSALIFDVHSPVTQSVAFVQEDRRTLYEDYVFLEYIFREENLPSAYLAVKNSPVVRLKADREKVPVSYACNVSENDLMDIVSRPEALLKPSFELEDWPLSMGGYVPDEICQTTYHETRDNQENRFIKYFLNCISALILKLKNSRVPSDFIAERLNYFQDTLEYILHDDWLQEIGELQHVPMNSQVLQKRSGYREIYYFFLNLEFAFHFRWDELQDNIEAQEKKLHDLYEYWCYFRLLEALDRVATRMSSENIMERITESGGWSIRLKKGEVVRVNYQYGDYKLYFLYNRLFKRKEKKYIRSYSLPFRPDYSIVVYKDGRMEEPAYLHFDAKYRSEQELEDFGFNSQEQKDAEKFVEQTDKQELRRKYKDVDLYKMHTYKDAIVESQGAYVLYPGDVPKLFKEDYDDRENIPSIGAIPLKPARTTEQRAYVDNLAQFMKDALDNIITKQEDCRH